MRENCESLSSSGTLKNIERTVENMHDSNSGEGEEHFYYVDSIPVHTKDEIPGRKTDKELRELVASKLKGISQVDTSNVTANVVDQIVSLTGSVPTYEQKRRVGEEIWNIDGVVRVLNELHVTEPTTAGPAHRD
jgi:osmotically-inducible protein OsmY